MQPLFHSTFLQALGFAIANSLWQTALVWLVYILVSHIFSMSAAAKYRMAVAAQFISFAWFIITIQFYYSQYSEALRQASGWLPGSQSVQAIVSGDTGFASRIIRYMVRAEQILPYISLAYILLMLFLCARWMRGYRQTQEVRNRGLQKIPVDWRLFVKRIATQLGIKKQIRLYLSETITTPLTIGFLKPIILIPVASINHLSTAQLEAVLLHELAHIKRYDYLANIILSVVEISLFFNPFTQLLSKRIHNERENSCDDWVLQYQYQAADYAEALLRIAYLQSGPAFAMAAAGKNDLLVRVKRMIGEKENRFNYRRQLLAFLMVTGMLGCIAWLNPAVPTTQKTMSAKQAALPEKKTQPIAVEPMAMKVSNPLFNPMIFFSEPLKAEMKKSIATAQKELDELPQSSSGHPGFIEALPPMIAGALELAAAELGQKNTEEEKALAQMELAKQNMEKLMRDSLPVAQMFRTPLKEEFARSLENIKTDIARAKTEIDKTRLMKRNMGFDQDRMKKEIESAMAEVTRIGLDKTVLDALQIPAMLFNEKQKPLKIKRPAMKAKAGEPQMPKITAATEQDNAFEVFAVREEEEASLELNPEFVITPALVKELTQMARLAAMHKLTPEAEKILRLKLSLLEKAFRNKIKILPALKKEYLPEPDSLITTTQ